MVPPPPPIPVLGQVKKKTAARLTNKTNTFVFYVKNRKMTQHYPKTIANRSPRTPPHPPLSINKLPRGRNVRGDFMYINKKPMTTHTLKENTMGYISIYIYIYIYNKTYTYIYIHISYINRIWILGD